MLQNLKTFDFFENKQVSNQMKKEKKKKFMNRLSSYWLLILGVQAFLFANDYLNFQTYAKNHLIQTEITLQYYDDFREAIDKNDSTAIISNFSSLLHTASESHNLIPGTSVLSLKADGHRIDSTTLETINYMYNQHYNTNISKEITQIENYQCFILSGFCHLAVALYKDDLLKSYENIKEKNEVQHYNVNHIEQYREWKNTISKKIDNKQILSDIDRQSPGDIYVKINK